MGLNTNPKTNFRRTLGRRLILHSLLGISSRPQVRLRWLGVGFFSPANTCRHRADLISNCPCPWDVRWAGGELWAASVLACVNLYGFGGCTFSL